MAIDFPSSPTTGQQVTSGGVTWTWDGVKWVAAQTAGTGLFIVSVKAQQFQATGTYTPSAGMAYCQIEAVGGGGGGGGAGLSAANTAATGGGGGSGAYVRGIFTAAQIGASQTITCGAGGSAGAAAFSSNGGVGGDTIIGSLITAKGGAGGFSNGAAIATTCVNGGAGGPTGTSVGPSRFAGAYGASSVGVGTYAIGGQGGPSHFGGGGGGGVAGVGGVGTTGSGGGGASSYNASAAAAGGAGGAGFVLITEFCTQ